VLSIMEHTLRVLATMPESLHTKDSRLTDEK
jgi:hypothetical protein